MIIALTGFMGVGKTTISEKLAKLILCKHYDLDKYIEERENMSVSDIFAKRGELYFRRMETFALREIVLRNEGDIVVLSLGGGALISPENQEIVKKYTYCIYLKASLSTIITRLRRAKKNRPILNEISENGEEARFKELFEAREEGYNNSASFILDVDNKSIRQIVDEIIAVI